MKKLISILLVVVMCLSLSSCVTKTSITVLEDGKIKINSKLLYSKTALESLVAFFNDNVGKEVNGEVLDKETAAEYEAYIETIMLNTNEETIDGKVYYVQEEEYTEDSGYISSDYTAFNKATPTEFLMYSYGAEFNMEQESLEALAELGEDIINFYKDITGEDITIEMTVTMPYKIAKTNVTLIDDYTIDLAAANSKCIYAITENADEALLNDENIEATISNMAKEEVLNTKTAKPLVEFVSKTSVRVEINDGRFSKYDVEYKVAGGEWKLYKTVDIYGYCKVKNLKPGKKYYFRTTGIIETEEFGVLRGIASKAVVKDFAKLNAPKFALSSIKKGFKVTFDKKPEDYGCYEIKYSTKKNMKKANKTWIYAKSGKVKGLKAKTKYYVQVRKSVDYTYSDWSKVKTIKTK